MDILVSSSLILGENLGWTLVRPKQISKSIAQHFVDNCNQFGPVKLKSIFETNSIQLFNFGDQLLFVNLDCFFRLTALFTSLFVSVEQLI